MLNDLFSFNGIIGRTRYVLIALIGVLIKHVADLAVSELLFHRYFSPLNYLVPLGVPTPITQMESTDLRFVASMAAISIPFAWVGLAITVKRFRTIGWPNWTVLLFFVPIANIVSFAIAALWPESVSVHKTRAPRWLSRIVPVDRFGAALTAVVLTALVGLIFVALGTRALSTYGWGLFAAIPFVQGGVSAMLVGTHERKNLWECMTVAILSVGLTCLGLLAVALEGAICIAMAAPLAIAFAMLGAAFGYTLQNRESFPGAIALLVCVLAAPTVMGAEAVVLREVPTFRVESSVIINAPPNVVWHNVVQFRDLPAPTEPIFLLGVAYPERARIVGTGVGAVRYCEFSTGDFVEPITVWKPDHMLAFGVRKSAQPMRELSPYPRLDTAHLHDYMVSKHGQFVLEALPDGRTRLTGTTWYQHHLWPASYWAIYSDSIIHSIHLRVLNHIKRLSEAS
jgi:uncharacterized membrane protein YhaH (DUF805 family)